MKKFAKDFKEFALRGNVIDMAIGVVIGGAFGAIVSSLVNNIIMPLISIVTGAVNVADLKVMIPNITGGQVELAYGAFIQAIIDFFLIALSIFICIKIIGKLHRKKEEEPAPPPEPTKEEVLLTEIRDLLKEQNSTDDK